MLRIHCKSLINIHRVNKPKRIWWGFPTLKVRPGKVYKLLHECGGKHWAVIEAAIKNGEITETEELIELEQEISERLTGHLVPQHIAKDYPNIQALAGMDNFDKMLEGFAGMTRGEQDSLLDYLNTVFENDFLRHELLKSGLYLTLDVKHFPMKRFGI